MKQIVFSWWLVDRTLNWQHPCLIAHRCHGPSCIRNEPIFHDLANLITRFFSVVKDATFSFNSLWAYLIWKYRISTIKLNSITRIFLSKTWQLTSRQTQLTQKQFLFFLMMNDYFVLFLNNNLIPNLKHSTNISCEIWMSKKIFYFLNIYFFLFSLNVITYKFINLSY